MVEAVAAALPAHLQLAAGAGVVLQIKIHRRGLEQMLPAALEPVLVLLLVLAQMEHHLRQGVTPGQELAERGARLLVEVSKGEILQKAQQAAGAVVALMLEAQLKPAALGDMGPLMAWR